MTTNDPFTPPRILRNPHIQSILNSVGPRKIRAKRMVQQLNSTTLILTAKDGTRLSAEYDRSHAIRDGASSKGLIILSISVVSISLVSSTLVVIILLGMAPLQKHKK
jgi:hypothetical protein